jgi:hypothetical protein
MKHKWYNEIVAWASGAEIENRFGNTWVECKVPQWGEQTEYRIKPQPKEPQYLYVYKAMGGEVMIESNPSAYCGDCIGKIKLENDVD